MRKIIYHVATTLDGYIANNHGGIEGFSHDDQVVSDYQNALSEYQIAIMGRKTYEFGYQYGLVPGKNPYPHMQTYVFSQSTSLDSKEESLHWINEKAFKVVKRLKEEEGKPIYLCGGGSFAGSIYNDGLIDEIVVKLNPVSLGSGIKLFDSWKSDLKNWSLKDVKSYSCGVILLHYQRA